MLRTESVGGSQGRALTDKSFLRAHHAELVALRIGQDSPGLSATLADVDPAGPEREKAVNLLIAVRGAAGEIKMHAVLDRLGEKCGLMVVRTTPHEGADVIEGAEHGEVKYALTKSEWESRTAGVARNYPPGRRAEIALPAADRKLQHAVVVPGKPKTGCSGPTQPLLAMM
jgi:hypothetical protein